MNISKERLEQMVLSCIDWITSMSDYLDAYNDLEAIGFSEAELRELGYGYIVDEAHKQLKEEEEE